MESKLKKGEMLSRAILIATNAHAGKFDKGGKPYILHPITIMYKLKTDDEELQCIGILHDVIEDCTGKVIFIDGRKLIISYQMLREEGMSERVIHGLIGVTKVPGQTAEEYEEGVFETVDRMRVKAEDLRHNSDLRRLKGVTEKDLARNSKYQVFFHKIQQRLAAGASNE